jgi:hypothetical protein
MRSGNVPQLETVLINFVRTETPIEEPYTPVALPKLHSIELGISEVNMGLVKPLRFPPAVAVGFLGIYPFGDDTTNEAIRHVLAG